MIVIAKNSMPKVFKKLLNRPDGCCYKSCKDLWAAQQRFMEFQEFCCMIEYLVIDFYYCNISFLSNFLVYIIFLLFFHSFSHRISDAFVILQKVNESFELRKVCECFERPNYEHFAKDSIPKSFSLQSFPFE